MQRVKGKIEILIHIQTNEQYLITINALIRKTFDLLII